MVWLYTDSCHFVEMGKGATRSKFLIRKGGVEQGMVDHPGNLLVVILFYRAQLYRICTELFYSASLDYLVRSELAC